MTDLFQRLRDADDICRAQPDRGTEPCPRCGYVSASKPAWADVGVTFALRGVRYRILGVGSTNRFAPKGLHFEDYLRCEVVSAEPWTLPSTPCPVDVVADALTELFKLPAFRPHELTAAYMIEDRVS